MAIPVDRVKNNTCGFSNLLHKFKLISGAQSIPKAFCLLKYQSAKTRIVDTKRFLRELN